MDKLNDLQSRLSDARKASGVDEKIPDIAPSKEMSQGLRAFMEMFGVLLGSGCMGWTLDKYFETRPIFMVIFILLGIVAAFFNLYKLSRNLGTAIGSNGLQSDEKAVKKPSQNES